MSNALHLQAVLNHRSSQNCHFDPSPTATRNRIRRCGWELKACSASSASSFLGAWVWCWGHWPKCQRMINNWPEEAHRYWALGWFCLKHDARSIFFIRPLFLNYDTKWTSAFRNELSVSRTYHKPMDATKGRSSCDGLLMCGLSEWLFKDRVLLATMGLSWDWHSGHYRRAQMKPWFDINVEHLAWWSWGSSNGCKHAFHTHAQQSEIWLLASSWQFSTELLNGCSQGSLEWDHNAQSLLLVFGSSLNNTLEEK